ncbi:2965_t:CDS:2 [Entrophospora sp. SA101]|nr:10264_t:CDS:2 [Entrophospora sp. SA101]CAJ0633300.1 11799_t:CDS:2 [Entrophospora sp. SA101]CAJ0752514.1 2965_t:CDS:2 [Entrophospora sp. SA101]CAJ0845729.1 8765_t:CDS:2 [Entrophospora sp. SA101]CAJ0846501.1 5716_t:CDS:2 [Entrophospora sp. SA101]
MSKNDSAQETCEYESDDSSSSEKLYIDLIPDEDIKEYDLTNDSDQPENIDAENQIQTSFIHLPSEIILRIIYELILLEKPNLPKTAVISLPLTCRTLCRFSKDHILWEHVFCKEYDILARKRRFKICNFRKIYYRRSRTNIDMMNSSLLQLEGCNIGQTSPSESIIGNVLDVLTSLWILVSENDGKNTKKLSDFKASEFCFRVFLSLYNRMDTSLKHLACVFISLKIISILLAYGFDPKLHETIVEQMSLILRERVINWNPNDDSILPMLECHALHIYFSYCARDDCKKPMLPSSFAFDSRKADKWLQWTDMVDIYGSNKILFCLRNDAYDWPNGPPSLWTGLCTNETISAVEKLIVLDLVFYENNENIDLPYDDFEGIEDVDKPYNDHTFNYIFKGDLMDDSGKKNQVEGESCVIDKGRRVKFKCASHPENGDKKSHFCGFMTAFGIIGRYWDDDAAVDRSGFFWIWEWI